MHHPFLRFFVATVFARIEIQRYDKIVISCGSEFIIISVNMSTNETATRRRRKQKKFILLMILMDAEQKRTKQKRSHSVWMKPWFLKRQRLSAYNNILQEFRVHDGENYRRYLRMNVDTYEFL